MTHTCKFLWPRVQRMKSGNGLTAPHGSWATLWGFNLQKTRHILGSSSEAGERLL